jgi:hypothetical protein
MSLQKGNGSADCGGRLLQQPTRAGQASLVQSSDEYFHSVDAVHAATIAIIAKIETVTA